MQTTLRIDDTLYRQAKVAAAREGITLTRLIEEALRLRLDSTDELAVTLAPDPTEVVQARHALASDVERAVLLERLHALYDRADERDRSTEGSAGPFSRDELYADRLDRFR